MFVTAQPLLDALPNNNNKEAIANPCNVPPSWLSNIQKLVSLVVTNL